MADDKTFTQEQLDAAVEKAVTAATGDVDGLKAKVEELIGANKALKVEARKAKDVDPAELAALEHQVEELTGKVSAAEKTAKDAEKARDAAVKGLETESAFTTKLLKQDGVKSALLANGVKDEDYLDTLSARFERDVSIVVDGDTRKAMVGDKLLADHIKEWAASDAGKKFVEAAVNSGGGASGGDTKTTSGKTMTRSAFDAADQVTRANFSKAGGMVVDEAA